MVFRPPRRQPPVEINRFSHPALGALRLLREEFRAKSGGAIFWTRHEFFRWEGVLNGFRFEVIPENGGPFPDMPQACITMVLGVANDEPALRRTICADLLSLAKDWAESGDLPEPTLESFIAGVRLDAIQVYEDWAPTVYYEEIDAERSIFAGHTIEVRFNTDGTLDSASIAG